MRLDRSRASAVLSGAGSRPGAARGAELREAPAPVSLPPPHPAASSTSRHSAMSVGGPRTRHARVDAPPVGGSRSMAIPDFAAEGLLDGLEDDRERRARLDLLERLHADGVALEELREAVEEQRLVLLPIERALGQKSGLYTREELSEEAGLDLEFLRRLWRALGMPEPGAGEKVFHDDDVDA